MFEVPAQYRKPIGRYEPIKAEGLTLYPITVDEYEEFTTARPAIEAMQQSFPVDYISMPLLSAYYAMEIDAVLNGEQPAGWFYRAILFLALSLRLGKGLPMEERIGLFKINWDPKDPRRLQSVSFDIDGETLSINPVQFTMLRPVLAAQNGIELISENANPELVEAERDIAEANSAKLDADFYTLKSSIATALNVDETEIDEWPILKFDRRRQSIQRYLDYIICGIIQAEGVFRNSGNPAPSPFFDKQKTSSSALMPLSQFAGGAGERAVQAQQASGAVNAPPPEFTQYKE